jgi:hypothetical protein
VIILSTVLYFISTTNQKKLPVHATIGDKQTLEKLNGGVGYLLSNEGDTLSTITLQSSHSPFLLLQAESGKSYWLIISHAEYEIIKERFVIPDYSNHSLGKIEIVLKPTLKQHRFSILNLSLSTTELLDIKAATGFSLSYDADYVINISCSGSPDKSYCYCTFKHNQQTIATRNVVVNKREQIVGTLIELLKSRTTTAKKRYSHPSS